MGEAAFISNHSKQTIKCHECNLETKAQELSKLSFYKNEEQGIRLCVFLKSGNPHSAGKSIFFT